MNSLAIRAQALSKRFGDFTAVNQISIDVDKASIYGFLGPNGCGKSTTIRMLCGLLTPSSGSAEVLGLNVAENAELLRRKIGYMTQKFSLYGDLSVLENLRFLGKIYQLEKHSLKSRIEELLSTYALDAMRHRFADNMSGGQRQRLALAAATLHKPDLLFLDEPTSAVDPENRRDFWEKLFDLCDQGTSILVSTHYMDEAERCHKLAILETGELRAEGSPEALMQAMGASVIEIAGTHLRQLKSQVLKLDKVRSAAQQGIRLRVLVDKSISEPLTWLQRNLHDQNALESELHLNLAHPSLEDVFVLLTGDGKAETDRGVNREANRETNSK